MARELLIVGMLLLGCGASDDGDEPAPFSPAPSPTAPPEPTVCDPSDVRGTYFLSSQTISGNCGDQASGLVALDETAGEGCENLSAPVRSENDCKTETHQRCKYEEFAIGATIETVAVLRNSGDGSLVTGTMTMTIRDARGGLACTGTYRVTFERQ
jgi:hypothetical protein